MKKMSHAFNERDLLRLYGAYVDQPRRYLLRSGSAPGVKGFLRIATVGLTNDHRVATWRMKPHIFRAALRNFLNFEPFPGAFASLVQESWCCSSCGAALHTPGLDVWAVTYLSSCKVGGGLQCNFNGLTTGTAESFSDVGVLGNTETQACLKSQPTDLATLYRSGLAVELLRGGVSDMLWMRWSYTRAQCKLQPVYLSTARTDIYTAYSI